MIVKLDTAQINAGLSRLSNTNMLQIGSEIGEIMLQSFDRNFESQGRYSAVGSPWGGSKSWAPLSPSYAKYKAKHPEWSTLINVKTGRLRMSLDYEASRESIRVGSALDYAEYPDRIRPIFVFQRQEDGAAIQRAVERKMKRNFEGGS